VIKTLPNTGCFSEPRSYRVRKSVISSAWQDADCRYPAGSSLHYDIYALAQKSRVESSRVESSRVESSRIESNRVSFQRSELCNAIPRHSPSSPPSLRYEMTNNRGTLLSLEDFSKRKTTLSPITWMSDDDEDAVLARSELYRQVNRPLFEPIETFACYHVIV